MKKGFSIAEILIALAIIGIVASVAIPSLIVNVDKQSKVAGLKKSFTVLSAAAKQLAADNGGNLNGVWSNGNDGWGRWGFKELLKNYMNVSQDCLYNVGCWPATTTWLNGGTPQDNWSLYGKYAGVNSSMVLADGSTIGVADSRGGNPITGSNPYGIGVCNSGYTAENDTCVKAVVDVNGFKSPNIFGRDIFVFYIRKNGTVTADGAIGTYKYSNNAGTNDCGQNGIAIGAGETCAGRIIAEGWQMNY